MNILIMVIVLLISVIFHEVAHGYVAYLFGDKTAKYAGRLTLNPISHIDLLGSIILPALFILSGSHFMIGWAKPVPVNSANFKNPLKDMMIVSLAGPLTNLSLAILASIMFKAFLLINTIIISPEFTYFLLTILKTTIILNLVLAVFNLFPIPPLDGSKVLLYFLPYDLKVKLLRLEPYGFLLIFILAYFGFLGKILFFVINPLLNMIL
ncbi:site-2 protease family protein [bacterium]|nr:site-2 protease family protein [bacterium]